MTTQNRRVSLLVALATASFVAAPVALVSEVCAQVSPVTAVTPYYGVVQGADAVLRAGDSDTMYVIARPNAGQVLRIDGESVNPGTKQSWLRVEYPAGLSVFLSGDAVTLDPGGATGTITKPVKLRAINLQTRAGSWAQASPEQLATGTKVTILGQETGADKRVNYLVPAPAGARAFIKASSIQRATQDQVNAYLAARGAEPKPIAATPPKPAPATPQGTPQGTPTGGTPTTANLTDPMAVPKDSGTPKPATTAATPTGAQPGNTPGSEAVGVQPAAGDLRTVELKPSPYEKLELAFEAVRKQPAETAEFTPLLAEFEAARAGLDPSSPTYRTMAGRMDQRIEYLRLWKDIQAQRRKLADAMRTATEDEKRLADRMSEVERSRQYTFIGRLSASSIYNGERLPLMYRVQTVSNTGARTLAYIKPGPGLNLDSKLGQVIGVIGETVVDPTKSLNIITPVRVDTLEPAATATVPSETPAEPPK
ncbi:MAG: hypothetical protein JNM80_04910 [Phycisphaerae bacterium]|nr:hypothetical protein [Phycisphaerae bacterium]